MNKQRHLKQILQVDKLSYCWLQALTNRLSLEYETSILKLSPTNKFPFKTKNWKKNFIWRCYYRGGKENGN